MEYNNKSIRKKNRCGYLWYEWNIWNFRDKWNLRIIWNCGYIR
jgi:hypothetical protein